MGWELGGTVHASGADCGVFVRLVDDVRAVLRVLIFEPTAYAGSLR